jgi:hypothetical protein
MDRERLERFFHCGLAVAPFCAREGVSVASFYHWRKKLGHNGRRQCMTDGHPRHRTGSARGRGVFQPVAVARGTPALVRGGRGFIPVASGWVPAAQAVCIQLPCGTRIEVDAGDLDALRTVVAEVVRADRGREAGVARC